MSNRLTNVLAVLAAFIGLTACEQTITGANPNLEGQDVRLTIIHTTDWHSRLIPYAFAPGQIDQALGLDPNRSLLGIGGIQRLAYLVGRERMRSARSLLLDSGDAFEGAPIFNLYKGEPEVRAQSLLEYDSVVVGNHEFDDGAMNFVTQEQRWKTFPLLAANYTFDDPSAPFTQDYMANIQPVEIINVQGLRVGIIGMGNLDALDSLTFQGNSLGIQALDTVQTVQGWVDVLRPQVDFIIVLSHLGPDVDAQMAASTRGINLILSGHLHIVLEPPEQITDLAGHQVTIVESGAFLKYMGRLDLVLEQSSDPYKKALYGFDIASFKYKVFPIDNSVDLEVCTVTSAQGMNCPPTSNASGHDASQDAGVDLWARMQYQMEPYYQGVANAIDLTRVVACLVPPIGSTDTSTFDIARYSPDGGDSALGDLVAEALQYEPHVLADFAVTNSLGMRDDLRGIQISKATDPSHACEYPKGTSVYSVQQEEMFNVLPFENTISTMYLSGPEVQELFDYNAQRSAGRGCATQVQVSGVSFDMICSGTAEKNYPHTENIKIQGVPLDLNRSYLMATNNYMAGGGSGFTVLKLNTTQYNTQIPMRAAVVEYIQALGGIVPCSSDKALKYPPCANGVPYAAIIDNRITAEQH